MRIVAFGFFILLLLGAAWSAAWFYVAHATGTQIDAWLKAQDEQGRSWTCPDRAIGGYPFAINVQCTAPTFTGQALDQTVTGKAAGLLAQVDIGNPHHLGITLQAPLTYRTSDGQAEVKASWSGLTIDLDGLPDVTTTALHASDVVVDGTFAQSDGQAGRNGGNAKRLDATFASVPDQAATPTLDLTIAIRGSAMPALDDLLGGQAPVDIDLTGRLDHAAIDNARTPEDAIETWRQAGGHLDLGPSRISHAESSVSGTGALALDDAHRPQGRLEASFVGLEPVLKRYGISTNLAAAGSILNALFGSGRPPAAPSAPGTLTLPISLRNGRLGIGPIVTQIEVPPLY